MTTSSFTDLLRCEVTTLQATFPDLADTIGRAHALVADGAVFVEDTGREAMVQSSSTGERFYHVNGHCACPASAYRREPCKHRLALRLYQRISDRLNVDQERWEPDDENPAFLPPRPPRRFPPRT